MAHIAHKITKAFVSALSFVLGVTLFCHGAAGEYYMNQSVRQTLRYIQGSRQYIVQADYMVTGIEETKSIGSGTLLQKAGGKFVVVRFKVLNKGAIPMPSSILLDLILIDGKMNRWEQSLVATSSAALDTEKFRRNEVSSGDEADDVLVFDLPENVKDYFVLLPGGAKISPLAYRVPSVPPGKGDEAKAKVKEEGRAADTGAGKRTATITENAAHMRAKPSLESDPVTWSKKGTVFEVTGDYKEGNGRKWYRVKAANGREYWIAGKVVKISGDQKEAEEGKPPKEEEKTEPNPAAKEQVEAKAAPAVALPPPPPVKPEPEKELKPPTVPDVKDKVPAGPGKDDAPPEKKETGLPEKVIVTSNAATLRALPRPDSEPVAWIKKGIMLEITEKAADGSGRKWYKTKVRNGKVGWIRDIVVKAEGGEVKKPLPEVKPGQAPHPVAKAQPAAVPDAVGSKAVEPASRPEVKAPSPVKSGGEHQSEPDIQDRQTGKRTATITENAAHMRAKPSLESDPVTWSKKGTVFEVTGDYKEGNGRKWYRVKAANGREYWIAGKVVKISGDQKEAEEGKPPKEEEKTEPNPAAKEQVEAKAAPAVALPPPPPVKPDSPAAGEKEKGKTVERAKGEPKNKIKEQVKGEDKGKSKSKSKRTATVIENAAYLRTKPSMDANPATWSVKGAVFEVTGDYKEGDGRKWYRVKAASGREYWIVGKVVKISGDQKEAEEGKPPKEAEKRALKKQEVMKSGPAQSESSKPADGKAEPAKEDMKGQAAATEDERLPDAEAKNTGRKTATVIASSAILRARPAFDSEKTGKAAKGAVLDITDEYRADTGKAWYKVKAPKGKESWISGSVVNISPFSLIEDKFIEKGLAVVEPAAPGAHEQSKKSARAGGKTGGSSSAGAVTVISEFAVLKSEPLKESKVITWAPKGTVFDIMAENADSAGKKWYKVKCPNDADCWIAGDLVDKPAARPEATGGKDKKDPGKGKKPARPKGQTSAAPLHELLDKASIFYKEGNCKEFVKIYEEAISIAAGRHDAAMEGTLRYSVAECYALLGKHEEAIKHLDRAIAIAKKNNNQELSILSFIGKSRVLIVSGDKKNAAKILKAVSEEADKEVFLNTEASDYLKALVSFQMAYILMDMGDEGRSREKLDYAFMLNQNFKMEDDMISLLKTVNSEVYESISDTDKMLDQAWSSYEKGDYAGMEKSALQALDSAKKLGYKRGMFNGTYYLAMARSAHGDTGGAINFVQISRDLAEKGNDEMSLGMAYNLMGNIYKQENEYEKAMYYCNKHLEIVRRTGNREGEAIALNNIGNLMMDKGDFKQALKYYEDSLKMILETGTAKQLIAQGYLSLGRAFKKIGDYNDAQESIMLAKNIFRELGNEGGELTGLWEMASNYGLQGEYNLAIKLLEENLPRTKGSGLKQNFINDLINYSEKSKDAERLAKYSRMKGN